MEPPLSQLEKEVMNKQKGRWSKSCGIALESKASV